MPIHPLPHQRLPRYLSQEEVRSFFAVIDEPRDRALFVLAYHHGLRVGEVLLLHREDVDLARGRLLVRRLKGGSWSQQVLFGTDATVLRTYLDTVHLSPASPLFPGRHGALRRRQIQLRFARYRELAGLDPRYTCHGLRHSIATHLLEAGASLEFVQDHLGHRDIRSTTIYARITSRLRESQMRALERSPLIVQPDFGSSPPPVEAAGADPY